MRLFVGIDLDENIRERIIDFVQRMKVRAPDVRFVRAETYHLTLKFLGETTKMAQIVEALRGVSVPQFNIDYRGTGFFPNERAPRIFWAGVHAPPQLLELAEKISAAMEPLGFARENSFKPHLTLARSGSGRPRPKSGDRANPKFQAVVKALASMSQPEFGTMTAREYFLYESRLSPRGTQYLKVERFPLGSAEENLG